MELAEKLFPDCFELEAFKLEEKRFEAMLVVNEKSYLLWTEDGELIKHGTGFLGRNQPKICHIFLNDIAKVILEGSDAREVFKNYVDLSRFSLNYFTMNFTISKLAYDETTLYHDLMSQVHRAKVNVRYGNRIKYVKTSSGYKPTFLLDENDRLDYDYYKVRLGMVYARLKMKRFNKKMERTVLQLMSQKNTMEEYC